MANPSVTYSFSNGTTADATQVNTNFTDIINALTDGTKSLTIDALTCAGAATFNGSVALGNGSVDDITVTGSLASTVPIKTNNSYDIGSSTLGLASVYLGSSGGYTTRIKGAATASYTLTFPATGGTSGYTVETDGSGTLSFVPVRRSPATASNYGLTATVSSNQLTIGMVGADGAAISSSNPVHLLHRNATATTGTPTLLTLTSAPTSIVIPNTATLGHASSVNQYVYVYLIVGTANEIAVTGQPIIDEMALQNATAVTTGSDDGITLYATSNHTSKPVRFLGRIKSNQGTAGTWASSPTEISLAHGLQTMTARSEVRLDTYAGYGSTDTAAPYFTNSSTTGTALTVTKNDSTNGNKITVNEDGIYAVSVNFGAASSARARWAIAKNATEPCTTNSSSLANTVRMMYTNGHDEAGDSASAAGAWIGVLRTGDVIRVLTDKSVPATAGDCIVHICKVAAA